MTSRTPLLTARGLAMHFGAVTALQNLDLDIFGGEVLAIVGDNGAGKSTLVKCLSGAYQPTAGRLFIDGVEWSDSDIRAVQAAGIEVVHQDLSLIDVLNVAENFFLGRERLRDNPIGRMLRLISKRAMLEQTTAALRDLGIEIGNLRRPVQYLSGGQRQIIAVARAVTWGSKVVLMDEPTAALGVTQSNLVLRFARTIADRGLGVVLITHNMLQVEEIADRVVVLRHGQKVADKAMEETSIDEVVSLITRGTGGSSDNEDGSLIEGQA